MLTITPGAGPVHHAQERRDLTEDLAERLRKRYELALKLRIAETPSLGLCANARLVPAESIVSIDFAKPDAGKSGFK